MIKYLIALVLIILPVSTSAQTRIGLGADASEIRVGIEDYNYKFDWYFASAGIEHQFRRAWLPGIAGGFLKEGKSKHNGTYITASLFHAFDTKHISIIVSGGTIYGTPGIQFDRTRLIYADGEVVGYKNVSMKRSTTVPGTGLSRTAILQPVVALKVRKYFWHFFIEGHGGIRLARFNTVSSDFSSYTYKEKVVPIPSLGIGTGFSF